MRVFLWLLGGFADEYLVIGAHQYGYIAGWLINWHGLIIAVSPANHRPLIKARWQKHGAKHEALYGLVNWQPYAKPQQAVAPRAGQAHYPFWTEIKHPLCLYQMGIAHHKDAPPLL